ncbi:MAG: DJ-1/PfpI family protein [Mameliella sp.]|nr:DJ-1/PfpI family protein [Phaeodactylibacter sp.]NRA50219.1 DJ-1/PfpI family protein [Phaeodactylibacter sp.]
MSKPLRVAALIHQGMEILDFAGPIEVFTNAGWEVFIVAKDKNPVVSQDIIKILPQYDIHDCPEADVLATFGGNSEEAVQQQEVIRWVQERAASCETLFSVCTGVFYFAAAGLLDGHKATTFHDEIDRLKREAPNTEVLKGVKYVDSGKIISAAGVSSGIDGALYLVERLEGAEAAAKIAEYIEYSYT